MATPTMPLPMTPEQLATVSQWMPPEQAIGMAAFLGPDALQYQLDHIHDNRGAETVVSVTIVSVLAVLAVALRLVCRRQMKVTLSWDDYTIIIGLVRPHQRHLRRRVSYTLICYRSSPSAFAFLKPTVWPLFLD